MPRKQQWTRLYLDPRCYGIINGMLRSPGSPKMSLFVQPPCYYRLPSPSIIQCALFPSFGNLSSRLFFVTPLSNLAFVMRVPFKALLANMLTVTTLARVLQVAVTTLAMHCTRVLGRLAPIPKSKRFRRFWIGLRRFQSRNVFAAFGSVSADSKVETFSSFFETVCTDFKVETFSTLLDH